jgi:rod shape-determining protein MreB and related proteins
MKIPLLSKINKKIGIDLGTGVTRIWVDGKGVIFKEPTCIAVDKDSKKVLAIGSEAVDMDGRVGDHIEIIYPVKNGEVYSDKAIKQYLKILLNKYVGSTLMLNPIIMVSVPVISTQADRQIITDIVYGLGAGEAYTIAQPLAASIGSGVPIADASGSFFLHMGEGLIEGVVISLGSIISLVSSELAGAHFIERIIFFLRENFDLKISRSVAEKIIKEVVSIDKKNKVNGGTREGALGYNKEIMIGGQDTKTENPKELKITSDDLLPETILFFKRVEELLRELLSKMPPELTVDVIDKGLLISGGLANIENIEDYFIEKLGISVAVVDNPETVVIEGIGVALEHLDLFKKSLGYR